MVSPPVCSSRSPAGCASRASWCTWVGAASTASSSCWSPRVVGTRRSATSACSGSLLCAWCSTTAASSLPPLAGRQAATSFQGLVGSVLCKRSGCNAYARNL
uniref:Uncharacterized protein n=1 Tax=Oryza sativa subsp. japonica TaxID=39947 RepID=Q8GS54_ORYSJ|nr:hypothetical protein [Oryza sativa Japonica Group]BAC21524.1 hypothetical protein [Oryza sativa Japonica Group]